MPSRSSSQDARWSWSWPHCQRHRVDASMGNIAKTVKTGVEKHYSDMSDQYMAGATSTWPERTSDSSKGLTRRSHFRATLTGATWRQYLASRHRPGPRLREEVRWAVEKLGARVAGAPRLRGGLPGAAARQGRRRWVCPRGRWNHWRYGEGDFPPSPRDRVLSGNNINRPNSNRTDLRVPLGRTSHALKR